jgi:hypothetical protein
MRQLNILALALVFAAPLVGTGCEHLRSKDMGKEDAAATEEVANAPAPLNPYDKKN